MRGEAWQRAIARCDQGGCGGMPHTHNAHCAIARACGFRKINFADKTFADDCETAKKANVFSLERFVCGL